MLIVEKYGGSSLATAQRVAAAADRAADHVRAGHRVVVVVSAQGDTTDQLLSLATQVSDRPSPRELDMCLTAGEQICAALMAMALGALGVDAVSLTAAQAGIRTDGTHGDARPIGLSTDRIWRELARGRTVVVTGFQGVSQAGEITTLGRGGSDTTAVALAAYLGADKCLIYTDVDGVYDRDPRKFPDAQRFDRIGHNQMLALARGGAQVLHDRSVELAKQYHVPIQVLSSFRPGPGTLVTDDPPDQP